MISSAKVGTVIKQYFTTLGSTMMTLLAQTIADSSYWADPQTSTWT